MTWVSCLSRGKLLKKKGPLDPSEYALMKKHSYKTLELLTAADAPCDIARWAANHHERLDDSGYPFRLRAPSLNTPSRIVAVARYLYRADGEPAVPAGNACGGCISDYSE